MGNACCEEAKAEESLILHNPSSQDAVKEFPNAGSDAAAQLSVSEHQEHATYEMAEREPETVFVPAPESKAVAESRRMEPFEGEWFREDDGQEMGTISGGVVIWSATCDGPDSPITVHSENQISIELVWDDVAQEHIGILETNAAGQKVLRWSDGEVWICRSATPGK